MKAISLWQPWASAIAHHLKTNETRSWATPYRGPIAIHAAKKRTEDLREQHEMYVDDHEAYRLALPDYDSLPWGFVVATAELVDCVPTSKIDRDALPDLEYDLGDYGPGRFAWKLAQVKRVIPFAYRGAQGLFELPDHVVSALVLDPEDVR